MNNEFHNSPNYDTINIHQTTHVGYVVLQPSWPRRHPILTAFLVLLAIGFVGSNPRVLFVVAAIWIGMKIYKSNEAKNLVTQQEKHRLINSANAQNEAFMQGHQFGTHGHFPTPP